MKLLRRVFVFIGLLLGNVRREIREFIGPAISFVQILKQIVDSPALDVATALTATQLDDKLLERIRKSLPGVVAELQIIEIKKGAKPVETLEQAVAALRSYPPKTRNALYLKIASGIAQVLNGEFEEAEADTLTQLAYLELKQNNQLPVAPTAPAKKETANA